MYFLKQSLTYDAKVKFWESLSEPRAQYIIVLAANFWPCISCCASVVGQVALSWSLSSLSSHSVGKTSCGQTQHYWVESCSEGTSIHRKKGEASRRASDSENSTLRSTWGAATSMQSRALLVLLTCCVSLPMLAGAKRRKEVRWLTPKLFCLVCSDTVDSKEAWAMRAGEEKGWPSMTGATPAACRLGLSRPMVREERVGPQLIQACDPGLWPPEAYRAQLPCPKPACAPQASPETVIWASSAPRSRHARLCVSPQSTTPADAWPSSTIPSWFG